jgi:hypothetical protein
MSGCGMSRGLAEQAAREEARSAPEAENGRKTDRLAKYTLMHGTVPVAGLELDRETGFIQKLGGIAAPEHLPVGVSRKKGLADRGALNAWWADRAIPMSRTGIHKALDTLGLASPGTLLLRCCGLSLSDHYWLRPENSDLSWERINFYQNAFSDDIGDVLFGADRDAGSLDYFSPDSSCDGNLKKRWRIADGKRVLLKGGSEPYRQQPLHEVIAAEIMRRLGIPHVPYTLTWLGGEPYSVCEDLTDEKTELVPAWRIIQVKKHPNSKSLYQHFTDCADELGIPGVRAFLDRMIVLDYIIANEDRHLNNFGAVRDAETLAWLGMAPVYDSGSCLGYDKSAAMMWDRSGTVCKPFKNHHDEQLKLVSSFDWIDFSALDGIGELIKDVLSDERAGSTVEEERIRVIAELTERRVRHVRALAGSRTRRQTVTNEDEVAENTAAAYGEEGTG